MSRGAVLLLAIVFAGCTSAGEPTLRVMLVDDYYWPQQAAPGIEVFPLVTALVVDRRDGSPLRPADEAASRAAARAWCEGEGRQLTVAAQSRFADGKWAFAPCIDRN